MSETNGQDKLYAGKFKTVEELETGYKNAASIFEENKLLKSKMEESLKVPDEYGLPSGITIDMANLENLKSIAKQSGINQESFAKLVQNTAASNEAKAKKFEEDKKSLGDETLNILSDYAKKYYPAKIADHVLKDLITNKDLRESALSHRQQLLNSVIPGSSQTAGGVTYDVTYDDVIKAREAHQKQPSNKTLKDKYLNLTSKYAHRKS